MNKVKFAESRNDLTQYIGAMLDSSDFEGKSARQIVAAALVEEAVKICKNDTEVDFYVAKPILRAANYLLQAKKKSLLMAADGLDEESAKKLLQKASEYNAAHDLLDALIESTKE